MSLLKFFMQAGDSSGSSIPDNAMLWDDGTPVLWDDGTYVLWI